MRDEEGDNEETDSGSPATSSCIDSESASTVVVLRGGGGSRHKGDFDNLVRGARWSVIVVWLISAITVAALTNVLLARSEQATFRAQFESSANQVVLMSKKNAANVFTCLESLVELYPMYAMQSNETMPFVTIQGFEGVVQGIRKVAKTAIVMYSPILRNKAEVEAWNTYSTSHGHWIEEGRKYSPTAETNTHGAGQGNQSSEASNSFLPFVYTLDLTATPPKPIPDPNPGLVAPVWQISPVPSKLDVINFNPFSMEKNTTVAIDFAMQSRQAHLSPPIDALAFFEFTTAGPISVLLSPVFDGLRSDPSSSVMGLLASFISWESFFEDVLPEGDHSNDITIVTQSCDFLNTFTLSGSKATFLGKGDLHDSSYDDMMVQADFGNAVSIASYPCPHFLRFYPSDGLAATYQTTKPTHYAIAVAGIFLFSACVFLAYDYFVSSRQSRTEKQAETSNAIVREMFPGDMAARLFEDADATTDWKSTPDKGKNKNTFGRIERDTIAELHPDATVLFADISGFTAWSSIRDPHQVFKLLESVFQAFDAIAKRYRVFKVETVGDCYVAVCGVPKPNEMHAVVMCSFARRAMLKFRWVCRSLELLLGPDTGDLALRIGMHSGPVTAGVLRGDRARFQLFGDTVNTASRIESSGMRERVHLSEQTALQLIKHGKDDWIVKRDDAVEAKGKGKLVTYWLKLVGHQASPGSVAASSVCDSEEQQRRSLESLKGGIEMPTSKSDGDGGRNERLVQWNSEILLELLQRVVTRRAATQTPSASSAAQLTTLARTIGDGAMVVEEVAEIIDMPDFVATNETDDVDAELSDVVVEQLRDFVSQVAEMYNDNPFHNFEHASHVTMSIHKLLGRIVAPTQLDPNLGSDNADLEAAFLHDHTCGITSDPLTQFAVVLSGLIHDLDHPGVSNGQLIKENPLLAAQYREKSVAEQNSVDLAWTILQSSDYADLRAAIYTTETELRRFRSLLVNSIIATDIFDKDQSTLRKNRWNKAFYETTPQDDAQEVKSRKATIVIEHLIQASDVAHTMQHWHVYQKWNQRLFDEMMITGSTLGLQ